MFMMHCDDDDDDVLIVCACLFVCLCVAGQVSAVQLAKENIERCCSDNIDAAERRAELREVELNKMIISLEAKHGT